MRIAVHFVALASLAFFLSAADAKGSQSPAVETPRAEDRYAAIRRAQERVVKIYGAGGLRQMEAYQSGILISQEGHVLTALSYVLDTDDLAVVLDDGRKLKGRLLGSDPLRELAVVTVDLEDETLPSFDIASTASADVGDRVFALSNLYGIAAGDEPVSVAAGRRLCYCAS